MLVSEAQIQYQNAYHVALYQPEVLQDEKSDFYVCITLQHGAQTVGPTWCTYALQAFDNRCIRP